MFEHIDENAARNPARLHLNDALTTGELLSVWQSLDESHRADLIAIAKGLAAQASRERQQDDRYGGSLSFGATGHDPRDPR
ncbi:hypothetical protein [Rhodopirellula sallentina]|uniref:hypothetical protein n=1 Tax=Rhodopirellula sallentina TaxID=1263869 RepID=UPI00034B8498|nr:hypothetical protein [Rhodopirellula sallentina]